MKQNTQNRTYIIRIHKHNNKIGWRERNQQDVTNLMFIIKLISTCSGIIMPIIMRTRVCTVHTARVPATHNHSQHSQCRTPYAAAHTLVLLMMGIMMPETCWDKSLIINIRLVASCWFLSLHPTFMMHGHTSLTFQFVWLMKPFRLI